jgi:hypothetical protein
MVLGFRNAKLCDLANRYNILEKPILSVFYHENGGDRYVRNIGMFVPNHQTMSLNIPEHHNLIYNAMLENMASSQLNMLKQYSQVKNMMTWYSKTNYMFLHMSAKRMTVNSELRSMRVKPAEEVFLPKVL